MNIPAMGSKGECRLCGKTYSKAGMTRHIEACLRNKEAVEAESLKPGGAGFYHIRAQGYGLPGCWYWMHLQVRRDATLRDLDDFLRDTWLECCGHLSAFTIKGKQYASDPMKDWITQGMKVPLRRVLSSGEEFIHEYDFGTTTVLELKLVSRHEAGLGEGEGLIQVLARNSPPRIRCSVCGEEATQLCVDCILEEGGLLCEECASSHGCGEDMLLPVVNSPRVGQCGYCG